MVDKENSIVKLDLFDIVGKKIAPICDKNIGIGTTLITFDANTMHLPKGAYMIIGKLNGEQIHKKLIKD